MKIKIDFSALEKAVIKMGAEHQPSELLEFSVDPIFITETKIFEVVSKGIPDIIFVDDIPVDKTTGLQVLVYMIDHGKRFSRVIDNPSDANRFHVSDCQHLKKMKKQKRYERYIITNNTSGKFIIYGQDDFGNEVKGKTELYVCQYCLDLLKYKGFGIKNSESSRKKFVRNFDIEEFFAFYSSMFSEVPGYTDVTAPSSVYGPEWSDISFNYRSSKKWCCESCGINLSDKHKLLHVHHINGVKSDHSEKNLKALCVDCHSKQPQHNHMRVRREDILFINKLRNKSRNKPRTNWDEVMKDADRALRSLIGICKHRSFVLPEVGFDVEHEGVVYAQVDLAWPKDKIAITLMQDNSTQLMRERGWTVYMPNEALSIWGA